MPKILVVDDDEQNLYLMQATLAAQGHQVTATRDGRAALASARLSLPDLVITDVLMPGMDGFSLCREWKRDAALRRVPLVVYTATYTDPKDEQLALNLGADLFVLKPQEPDEFLAIVGDILARAAAGAPAAPPQMDVPEEVQLKEYNAALVRKLESKLLDLEESHRALAARDAALRQSHKMEAIGRMAGGVAHDFNNLLTVVSARAEMILQEPLLSEDARDNAAQIGRACQQGSHLTRQLLLVSRGSRVEASPVRLDDAIRDMGPILKSAVGSGVELVMKLAAGPALVRVGPGQIEQVMLNLALNARDAMAGDGRVTVETSFDGEAARLAVSDTGCGMGPEVLAHLFEPFFTTKPTGGGTGLGLAVVYGIVHQWGGEVAASSEPGRGTTISARLPLAE